MRMPADRRERRRPLDIRAMCDTKAYIMSGYVEGGSWRHPEYLDLPSVNQHFLTTTITRPPLLWIHVGTGTPGGF
jgi:hypothetical protein